MKNRTVISIGTMYVDINCVNFPFTDGLPVNRETVGNGYELDLGGSALNFAKITTALGVETIFIGKTGKDAMSELLLQLMRKENIIPSVITSDIVQTNLAIHYIHNDGSSIMSSCGTANQNIRAEEIEAKLAEIKTENAFLYLGGVFKLKSILSDLPSILERFKQRGGKVILDHGRINNAVSDTDIKHLLSIFPYVDLYLPSEDEFNALWKGEDIQQSYKSMTHTFDVPITAVKQAEKGATGFINGQELRLTTPNVNVVNTVGAGDTFNAAFIKAYIEEKEFAFCIRYACSVAAAKISGADYKSIAGVKK